MPSDFFSLSPFSLPPSLSLLSSLLFLREQGGLIIDLRAFCLLRKCPSCDLCWFFLCPLYKQRDWGFRNGRSMESSCGASGNSKWGGAEIWKLLSDNHDLSVTHVGILSFEVFHFNAGAWEAEAGTFLRVLASSGYCLSYWSIAGKRHHDHSLIRESV